MILEINRQVIERSASSGISIEELHLDDEIKDHFIDAVKEKARKKPNGIIINNIDVFIQKTQGQILSDINFSREVMIELGVCFLFWFSEENLSEFSNRATDLYLRRDRSVIRFKETFKPSLEKLSIPHDRIDKQFAASLKQRRVKIELLEKQLEGARKKTYKKERIAREIVFDLVNAYLDADDLKMALCLFKEFKKYFENSSRVDDIELMAWVYFQSRDFNSAETWYRKSLEIFEKQGNEHEAASTYHQLGIIAQEQRDFKTAQTWYKKSLEIKEKQGNEHGAAMTYHQLGIIAQEQRDFKTAQTWYKKSLEIFEKQGNEHGAASTYHQLGRIAEEQRDFKTAQTWYKKSLEIKEKQGNEHGAAMTYHQLGIIAQEQGEFKTAQAWYKKSLEIFEKQGNINGAEIVSNSLNRITKKNG